MKKTSLLIILVSALCTFGCAKKRQVERVPDPDKQLVSKHLFTGTTPDGRANTTDQNLFSNKKVWLAKVTVVKTSANDGFTFVGQQSDLKAGFFAFTEGRLKFYNVINPFKERPSSEAELINSWKIKHRDTRLSEIDGKVTNREEENNRIPWNKKRLFSIDFSDADIKETATFPNWTRSLQNCYNKASSYIVDGSTEYLTDAINFTVGIDYKVDWNCAGMRRDHRNDYTFTVQYKYSFKQLKKSDLDDYKPFVYSGETDPLMKKYGYFNTVVEELDNDDRYQNKFLMSRWHPNKEHVYYFDKTFPEEYKWMIYDMFKKTNNLFERNHLKMRFSIKENDGSKEFGDLRYSFVKFVTEKDNVAPLGFGPHDSNPYTGEIIAANLIIWTGAFKYIVTRTADKIDREKDRYKTSSLFNSMKTILGDNKELWTETSKGIAHNTEPGKVFRRILPEMTYTPPWYNQFSGGHRQTDEEVGLFKFKSIKNTGLMDSTVPVEQLTKEFNAIEKMQLEDVENFHLRNTTIYPIEPSIELAVGKLIDGESPKKIMDTMIYRTTIHELGHNLNLRHNFYGSMDKAHFGKPIEAKDDQGNPILDKETKKPIIYQKQTSTVMEYLTMRDEIHLEQNWESYDEAALVFAYSGGQNDIAKKSKAGGSFLYCTDEHAATNSFCNRWDHGTTPSEIMLSLIEQYEDSYWSLNYRKDRAYWGDGFYPYWIYSKMLEIKRFLVAWTSGMDGSIIRRKILETKATETGLIEPMEIQITKDLIQTIRLSIAFFNAVLQQSQNDRPFRSQFDSWTGAKERTGIFWDKLFAMYFLMSDDSMFYNSESPSYFASYLSQSKVENLGQILDKVMENTLTVRVDMEPWFINYGRYLFATNVHNPYNFLDADLKYRMRVDCYKQETFEKLFGIDPDHYIYKTGEAAIKLDAEVIKVDSRIKEPFYSESADRIGVARIDGEFYVTSSDRTPYTFKMIEDNLSNKLPLSANEQERYKKSHEKVVDGVDRSRRPLAIPKGDLKQMFRLYNYVIKTPLAGELAECQ